MPRFLTLVRHAKSSWNDDTLPDFDRPLNNRGLKNAPEMGMRLAESAYSVDKIIASPALRAITTAELIATQIGYDSQRIIKDAEIYNASIHALVDLVTSLKDDDKSVMLVGHNPGFTYLYNYLCSAQLDNMPTCSIAQIRFGRECWGHVSEHDGELMSIDFPKNK